MRSSISVDTSEIIRDLVIKLDHEEDSTRQYSYTNHETGRVFIINKNLDGSTKNSCFLYELTPIPRYVKSYDKAGNPSVVVDRPKITDIITKYGPNLFAQKCAEIKLSKDGMIFNGSGYGVGSLYYDSLEECAKEISKSIQENRYYKSFRALTAEETKELKESESKSREAYWKSEAKISEASENYGAGLFKGCHDMLGDPLRDDIKKLILSYLNDPKQDSWLKIRGYLITSHTTLWQAWTKFEASAPRSGNKGFPDSEILRQTIRFAVERRKTEIQDKIEELANSKDASKPRSKL